MSEYRLDDLGWFQFERLCQSLLKAQLGLDLEAWGGTSDLGRDAYATGPLRYPNPEEEREGPFVFQAKFVSGANTAGADPLPALLKAIKEELKKIEARKRTGVWERPAVYTLLTNVPLTPGRRKEVLTVLRKGLPDSDIGLQAAGDIDALLDQSPAVRLAFPQILGLRDIFSLLQQSVHRDVIARSRGALEMSKELAKTFVPTSAYNNALQVLGKHRFVVLTGPPEMGKTTIARMIALARLSEGWEAYECRGPEDLLKVHNPDERQVFVADDAFGSTEYQPAKGNVWADELDGIIHLLDSSHWLLITSRPAPLRTALERLHLQGAAAGFPTPQEVLVDASELSLEEKAQMLYRHAKSDVESSAGRDLIAHHALEVVEHEHFTPLRIHRFVTDQLPTIIEAPEQDRDRLMAEAVTKGMERSTSAMKTSFARLPSDCRALMISMVDTGEAVIPLADLAPAFERHLGRAPARPVEAAADIVDAHFVRVVERKNYVSGATTTYVEWVHPSVRDLVIDHLMADAGARRSFLANAEIDGLMMALSSAGGSEGKRQLPLIQGDAEWTGVRQRLLEMTAAGQVESSLLLALLNDIARLAADLEGNSASNLSDLVRLGLDSLREQWAATGYVPSVIELREFYRAAATQGQVDLPDVASTWERTLDAADFRETWTAIDAVTAAADELLTLVELLERYDPDQLQAFSFPDRHSDFLVAILEEVEEEAESLDSPYVMDENDPEEYGEEVPDLDWLSGLEDLLVAIQNHLPELEDRCNHVVSRVFDAAHDWEMYEERQRGFYEPEPDDERYGGIGRSGSGGDFSVSNLFSDL